MAYKNIIIEAHQLTHPAQGSRQPFRLSGVTEEGKEIAVKVWPDNPALRTFQAATFPVHYQISAESKYSDYAKMDEWTLSNKIPLKTVGDGGNGSRGPSDAPGNVIDDLPPLRDEPPRKSPERAVGPPTGVQTTPQGVMSASRDLKDRTITCLAIMKSVIESGGDEADFDRWMRKLAVSVDGQ